VLQYIINDLQSKAVAQWVGKSLTSKVRVGYFTHTLPTDGFYRVLQLW
jgi:hypothetical protein